MIRIHPEALRTHAREALELANPMIRLMMDERVIKRRDLHIVVGVRNATSPSTGEVLATRSYGNPDRWEHDYEQLAQSKFEISARTGLNSREVQYLRPDLIAPGDTKFWGSVVMGEIVVACSGVQPWYDEAISNAIAGLFFAWVNDLRENDRADDSSDFYDRS